MSKCGEYLVVGQKIARSPPTSQRLDQADGGDVALRGDLGGLTFRKEAGALGVEEFEITEGATLIGLANEVSGFGGGGEGIADGAGLLAQVAGLGETGLHIADAGEDGLAVIRDGLFAGGFVQELADG